MSTNTEAIIEDLYHVPDNQKAEIVHGEIVLMSPTGKKPNRAGFKICFRLYEYELRTRRGIAVADNAGFSVNLPHRKAFSPDAAFYVGKDTDMKFFEGAPVFAAEVRSENDYGPAAERDIQEKIADYFAAGPLVVWDVDLIGQNTVRVYRSDNPDKPTIYRRGEVAKAEPAVPGWSMAVDDLFQ
ncbi:MAG: Uma2 family endonuclease [Pyrinomonadaceae bacterium]|nr:Uma2 family endonuclease [Pyrinomonadaceae bacterium]